MSEPQSQPRILISGASIAGPLLATHLASAGHATLVVELSPSLRTTGQLLDIKGPARTVMRRTGANIEATIRNLATDERGKEFVAADGSVFARVGVVAAETGAGGGVGACDIEVPRGELARVFYERSLGTGLVRYRFGDCIAAIEDRGDEGVEVLFESGKKDMFDVVCLADGMHSRARDMVFRREEEGARTGEGDYDYQGIGYHGAFFTVPYEEEEHGTWSKWYTADKRRWIMLRPDPKRNVTHAYLTAGGDACEAHFRGYRRADVGTQKGLWRGMFAGAGWKTEKILEQMGKAEDFYMTDFAQVKAKRWAKGRVVLVGDAGWCPSPMSGMGTSGAMVGAYVLAGELGKVKDFSLRSLDEAFGEYERVMRPFVEEWQRVPLWAFRFMTPETAWGVWGMQVVLGVVSMVVNWKGFGYFWGKVRKGGEVKDDVGEARLPVYNFSGTGDKL